MKALAPIVLPPLSALYGAVARARLALYQRGTLSVSKLDGFVISVGNITTGGTGKTPLVEWLARVLARDGRRVCILTRGYGRANASQRVIVSDGENVLASANDAGDEALLLANHLKGLAAVVSDADRIAAGRWARGQLGADTFILDDGFQHLRVLRDLNIVTIDGTNPYGGGHLLPYGRLREPLSGLRRADCIVITRTEQVESTDEIASQLARLSGGRSVILSKMRPCGFSLLTGKSEFDSAGPSHNHSIAAFCGVGNPEAFFNQLRTEKYKLALTRVFPDHHSYNQKEVNSLVQDAKQLGVDHLVTTAKDAVKLTSFNFDIPCYVLEIEIAIQDEARLLEMLRQ